MTAREKAKKEQLEARLKKAKEELEKIKITYETAEEIKPQAKAQPEIKKVDAKKAENKAEVYVKAQTTKEEAEPVVLSQSDLNSIKAFAEELLAKMKITGCDVSVNMKEDSTVAISVMGDASGVIIGRHGETLDAIQYIISLFVNKNKDKSFVRVNFDAENYRVKRKETLERLARQKAFIAVKKKGNVTMEPMQAYERRIIHASLQNFNNISTYSIGDEPRRRVVIAFTQK